MKLLTTLLLVLLCNVCLSQTKPFEMKCYQIKSSQWNSNTSEWDDLTDWQPSTLMFTLKKNTLTIDNVKNSRYELSNFKRTDEKDGIKGEWDAVDEKGKTCTIIFYYPNLKKDERQWNLVYIMYNDLLWEHKVRRYHRSGNLDNFLDN